MHVLLAQLDSATVWAVTVPLTTGLLGVAWKLGSLDRSVKDLEKTVEMIQADTKSIRSAQVRGGRRFTDPK